MLIVTTLSFLDEHAESTHTMWKRKACLPAHTLGWRKKAFLTSPPSKVWENLANIANIIPTAALGNKIYICQFVLKR